MTEPYKPPPAAPVDNVGEERMWAMFCHLAAFSGCVIPFGNIVGPLLVWQIKKDEYAIVDDQGKESLNFQISLFIYMLVAGLSLFVLIGLVLVPVVAIFGLVMTVIGAIKANSGKYYRYPLTIRVIK